MCVTAGYVCVTAESPACETELPLQRAGHKEGWLSSELGSAGTDVMVAVVAHMVLQALLADTMHSAAALASRRGWFVPCHWSILGVSTPTHPSFIPEISQTYRGLGRTDGVLPCSM